MWHCTETVDTLHNIRLELTLTLDAVINLRLGLLYVTSEKNDLLEQLKTVVNLIQNTFELCSNHAVRIVLMS